MAPPEGLNEERSWPVFLSPRLAVYVAVTRVFDNYRVEVKTVCFLLLRLGGNEEIRPCQPVLLFWPGFVLMGNLWLIGDLPSAVNSL